MMEHMDVRDEQTACLQRSSAADVDGDSQMIDADAVDRRVPIT